MRLGAYPCRITPGTLMMKAYGAEEAGERHRHRYEFNNYFREAYTEHGGRRRQKRGGSDGENERLNTPHRKWPRGSHMNERKEHYNENQ